MLLRFGPAGRARDGLGGQSGWSVGMAESDRCLWPMERVRDDPQDRQCQESEVVNDSVVALSDVESGTVSNSRTREVLPPT